METAEDVEINYALNMTDFCFRQFLINYCFHLEQMRLNFVFLRKRC